MAGSEYPEVGEFVIATVESIFKQGAFVTLDEYNKKRGMLHLSEISLKWIRNIHDYVRVGQKVVLQVLRVDPARGHIDLSLRRVTDAQRKQTLQEVKKRQRAKKLLEVLSKEVNVKFDEIYKRIDDSLVKEYGSLYNGLEAITVNNEIAKKLDIDEKVRSKLIELVVKSIKPPFVEITGYVELRSFESDGIDVIKESLLKIEEHKNTDCKIDVSYISAPIYRVHIKAPDYKIAEKTLREAVDGSINHIKEHHGVGEFHRELEKK